jgi:hypothetical protein
MVKLVCTFNNDVICYEPKSTDSMEAVTVGAANMHNLRLRCKRLAFGLRQLALFGPMKPGDKQV